MRMTAAALALVLASSPLAAGAQAYVERPVTHGPFEPEVKDKVSRFVLTLASNFGGFYPDAQFRFWVGLSAPAKTPRPIVDKLHDATEKALAMPALREKLAKLGVAPEVMSVEEFGKFFREDLAATVQFAKDANIQPVD